MSCAKSTSAGTPSMRCRPMLHDGDSHTAAHEQPATNAGASTRINYGRALPRVAQVEVRAKNDLVFDVAITTASLRPSTPLQHSRQTFLSSHDQSHSRAAPVATIPAALIPAAAAAASGVVPSFWACAPIAAALLAFGVAPEPSSALWKNREG